MTLRYLPLAILLAPACEGPAPVTSRRVALTAAPAPRVLGLRSDRPELRRADGALLVRGGWGRGQGEFGRVDAASRPGPMSLAVDEGGIHLLDQVNRRIQRFDARGRYLTSTPGIAETAEDLVSVGGTYWILTYVPGVPPRYRIDCVEPVSGRQLARLELPPELALVTRLDATGDPARPELWLELAHRESVLVARGTKVVEGAGRASARRLGRPAPGLGRVLARREGRAVLIERVLPGRYTGRHLRLELPEPVLAIEAFDSAPDGTQAFLLGLDAPGAEPRRVAAVVRPGRAALAIDLAGARACDVFRPIALGPDGALHVLETDEQGASVRRFSAAEVGR